ncbi:MAG: hypothetical protein ACRC92_16040 [Peptostreptococcaceae bacterium]
MYEVINKNELELALKNKENDIVILNEKIIDTLKPLCNVSIPIEDRNRCKFTLEKSYDGSAFMGVFGFAPIVADIGKVSFFKGVSIISAVGLHQILVIIAEYNIKLANNELILNKI